MVGRVAGLLLLSVGSVVVPAAAHEADDVPSSAVHARVRTSSPRFKALIDDGLKLSSTFRQLASALLATDGVVYVEEGFCYRGLTACLEWRVTAAGGRRLLFVRLSPRRSDDDVISSVAHELQHALEVLRLPGTVSKADFVTLFSDGSRLGAPSVVETDAALRMGDNVRGEVRRARRAR